ncbi:MAG: ROK family protein [Actinomycetota bacterium]|nr:ROK family protein [Actinomycetota bacterium]MDP9487321.1 ROK family protein [Actinomycetota bacterium]
MRNKTGTAEARSRYPLVQNEAQAAIMAYAHVEARPVSRGRFTEVLGSSRGKASAEVARLTEAGLLAEEGLAESEGGRRSSLLGIPRSAGLIVAVDIGATSVDVALTTLGSVILAHKAEPADVRLGPRSVLGRVKEIVAELLEEQGACREDILAVGVGVPGPVEQATGLLTVPPIMPGWDRYPIREVLVREYAAPVFVDNDVNVMALGEHWGGVGRGIADMIFVKVGTGIGSGIIIGDRLHRGPQGCAGDLGHVMVDPNGPTCTCGNRGCLESMAAAPAMVAEAERCARRGESAILAAVLEERGELTTVDIGEAARRGDNCALDLIRTSGRLVGQTLASLVSVLNPSLIVIGGGVSHIGNTLLAEIRSAVYQRSLPLATRNLPVVMSELDERAGVVGASVMAAGGVLAATG